jgi:peptide/nickel transport system substrate-binding protein
VDEHHARPRQQGTAAGGAQDRHGRLSSMRCVRPHKVPKDLQWDFFGPMLLGGWAPPAFDLAEAKKPLKEAGYDGASILYQMLNNYYTNQLQTAQIMVEQWKAVGLNVVIEMKENWAQILLGRCPGRGICENSNSSWLYDPVASLSAYGDEGNRSLATLGMLHDKASFRA